MPCQQAKSTKIAYAGSNGQKHSSSHSSSSDYSWQISDWENAIGGAATSEILNDDLKGMDELKLSSRLNKVSYACFIGRARAYCRLVQGASSAP
jgi:hypothetical protein